MSGGGSNQQTQTTTAQPSAQQMQLLNMAMPNLQQFAAGGGLHMPGDSSVAGFTQPQLQAQNMAMGAADAQAPVVGSAAQGSQFLTSGAALRPDTNPALAQTIKAATLPIEQQLTETTLPQIREAATGAGQYGGSRGEIAEGIASRGASQAEGAVAADLANRNYQAGLGAMNSALQTSPSVAQEQTMPATTVGAVGDVQQAQQQAELNDQIARGLFPQINPLLTGQELAGIAAGVPGGSNTTTASGNQNPSLASLLTGGGAVAGGLLGKGGLTSLLPGAGGAAGTAGAAAGAPLSLAAPATGAGAAGGVSLADLALLGLA